MVSGLQNADSPGPGVPGVSGKKLLSGRDFDVSVHVSHLKSDDVFADAAQVAISEFQIENAFRTGFSMRFQSEKRIAELDLGFVRKIHFLDSTSTSSFLRRIIMAGRMLFGIVRH